jgi:hypothetical protein
MSALKIIDAGAGCKHGFMENRPANYQIRSMHSRQFSRLS